MKIEIVKELMAEFEKADISRLKVEVEGMKVELEKNTTTSVLPSSQPIMTSPMIDNDAVASEPKEETGCPVKSPIVGVFYSASSPTTKPFVKVGDQVSKGQILCIIEAMKVMNEIKAPTDGVIKSINVHNNDLVEFNQVLMMIEE